ncbi:MAG TPA: hypothetical protein VM012_13495, partial [Flavitalea sp.]|nr:hypothetical protein [Flavitalea sp.]
DELIEFFKPEWNEIGSDSIHKRLEIVKRTHPSFDLLKVFTGINELSASIEKEAFILSHLLQPDFFCRIRPGFENEVLDNLSEKNKLFSFIPPATVAFNSRIDLEKLFTPDRELVVQDLSSQEVGSFFSLIKVPGMQVWDCCAGSGGKSILAFDLLPDCKLTVSDKRDSILINLIKRFRAARIQQYISFTADVSRMPIKSKTQFDLIIADVPCSGSGTWSRTPEQLISFDPQMITKYADLQKQITGNILHNLKTGGYVLYVTCSVFEQENEQIVRHLSTQFPLTIIKHGIIKGYDRKADTLYAALLRLDATLK